MFVDGLRVKGAVGVLQMQWAVYGSRRRETRRGAPPAGDCRRQGWLSKADAREARLDGVKRLESRAICVRRYAWNPEDRPVSGLQAYCRGAPETRRRHSRRVKVGRRTRVCVVEERRMQLEAAPWEALYKYGSAFTVAAGRQAAPRRIILGLRRRPRGSRSVPLPAPLVQRNLLDTLTLGQATMGCVLVNASEMQCTPWSKQPARLSEAW